MNSNVYKIHFIVQTIQKQNNATAQNKFVVGVDKISGNYRGSVIIERYIDPNLEPAHSPRLEPGHLTRSSLQMAHRRISPVCTLKIGIGISLIYFVTIYAVAVNGALM